MHLASTLVILCAVGVQAAPMRFEFHGMFDRVEVLDPDFDNAARYIGTPFSGFVVIDPDRLTGLDYSADPTVGIFTYGSGNSPDFRDVLDVGISVGGGALIHADYYARLYVVDRADGDVLHFETEDASGGVPMLTLTDPTGGALAGVDAPALDPFAWPEAVASFGVAGGFRAYGTAHFASPRVPDGGSTLAFFALALAGGRMLQNRFASSRVASAR